MENKCNHKPKLSFKSFFVPAKHLEKCKHCSKIITPVSLNMNKKKNNLIFIVRVIISIFTAILALIVNYFKIKEWMFVLFCLVAILVNYCFYCLAYTNFFSYKTYKDEEKNDLTGVIKNEKIKIIITLLLTLLICTSCISVSWVNFCNNAGKSKWVSNTPNIWFEQKAYNLQNGNKDLEGEINIDGKITPIYVVFGVSYPSIIFYNLSDYKNNSINNNQIFNGYIKLTKDGFIVTVDERNKDIFVGKYKTITFVRGQLGIPER